MNSRNPNTAKTLAKKYSLATSSKRAHSVFVGSVPTEIVNDIVNATLFHAYEKLNQKVREQWLRTKRVPREYEELIRLKQPGRKRFPMNFETDSIKGVNPQLLAEWKNKVVCMDCVEGMRQLPEACTDLVVFSPPYDALRTYEGKPEFDLHRTGEQVYRILKDGGMCAMVIQDQTKDFGKSMTSFKTAVDWVERFGFKLFECVIYHKNGTEGAWWKNRFRVDHEYIFLFLKGARPLYFNKEPLKILSKHGGKVMSGFATRKTNGKTNKSITKMINPTKCRGTVWDYMCAGDKNKIKRQHPAPFPDKIPYDLIQCFCPEGGLVIDPYMGSGSTAVAAIKLNKSFMGFDISQNYITEISEKRIAEAYAQLKEPLAISPVMDDADALTAKAGGICQTVIDLMDSNLTEDEKKSILKQFETLTKETLIQINDNSNTNSSE